MDWIKSPGGYPRGVLCLKGIEGQQFFSAHTATQHVRGQWVGRVIGFPTGSEPRGGFPTAPRLDLTATTGGALGLGYPSGPSQPRPETNDGDGERVVGMGTSWGQVARRRLRARSPFSPGSTSNGPGPALAQAFGPL